MLENSTRPYTRRICALMGDSPLGKSWTHIHQVKLWRISTRNFCQDVILQTSLKSVTLYMKNTVEVWEVQLRCKTLSYHLGRWVTTWQVTLFDIVFALWSLPLNSEMLHYNMTQYFRWRSQTLRFANVAVARYVKWHYVTLNDLMLR